MNLSILKKLFFSLVLLFPSFETCASVLDFSELYFGKNDPDNYSMSLFSQKNLPKSKPDKESCPKEIRPYLNDDLREDSSIIYVQNIEHQNKPNKTIFYKTLSTESLGPCYAVALLVQTPSKSTTFFEELLKGNFSSYVSFSGGLLIFPKGENDAIIFTFGAGKKSLLHPLGIVKNWGRNLVASEMFFDKKQVREISAMYYRNPIPSIRKERSSKVANIDDFGIEVGSEEIEMLRGRPLKEYGTRKIFCGQDSFNFSPCKKQYSDEGETLISIKKISDYFYEYSKSKDFLISRALRHFIDEELKNEEIKKRLDLELLKIMKQKPDEAEKVVFLHDDAFRLVGKDIRFGNEQQFFDDFLRSTKLNEIHSFIKVGQRNKGRKEIPFSRLIYSLPIKDPKQEEKFYRFGRGSWFEVDATRFKSIKKVLRDHKISREELGLPGYCLDDTMGESPEDYKELRYNRRAVEHLKKESSQSAFFIDRHNLSLGKEGHKFEFGDIFLEREDRSYVIHVKRAGAKSFSHHREQVERSAEYLASYFNRGKEFLYPSIENEIDNFYEEKQVKKEKVVFKNEDSKKILSIDNFQSVRLGSEGEAKRLQKLGFKEHIRALLNDKQHENLKSFFSKNISVLTKTLNALYAAIVQGKMNLEGEKELRQQSFSLKKGGTLIPKKTTQILDFLKKVWGTAQQDKKIFGKFFKDGILNRQSIEQITFVLAVIDDRKIRDMRKEAIDSSQKSKDLTKINKSIKEKYSDSLMDGSYTYSGKKNPLFKNQDLWGLERTRVLVQEKGFCFNICVTNEEIDEDWDAFGKKEDTVPGLEESKKRKRSASGFFGPYPQNSVNPPFLKKGKTTQEDSSGSENETSSCFSEESDKDSDEESYEDFFSKDKLKKISEFVVKIDTSRIQKFSFLDSNNENGQYSEYYSVPTVGDGNCFFHTLSIEDPDEKRQNLYQRIEDDEDYANRFKDITYEYYDGLIGTQNEKNIPGDLAKLFKENSDYATARNVLLELNVDPMPKELQASERHSVNVLKHALTHENIIAYMKRFKINSGLESYIPFRPDAFCLASYFLESAATRANIFTADNGVLTLLKSASSDPVQAKWPILNILFSGNHYTRLYNPSEKDDYKRECEQIYRNYRKWRVPFQ